MQKSFLSGRPSTYLSISSILASFALISSSSSETWLCNCWHRNLSLTLLSVSSCRSLSEMATLACSLSTSSSSCCRCLSAFCWANRTPLHLLCSASRSTSFSTTCCSRESSLVFFREFSARSDSRSSCVPESLHYKGIQTACNSKHSVNICECMYWHRILLCMVHSWFKIDPKYYTLQSTLGASEYTSWYLPIVSPTHDSLLVLDKQVWWVSEGLLR